MEAIGESINVWHNFVHAACVEDSKQEAVRECGQLTGRMEEAKIHSSIRISKLEKEKQVLEERLGLASVMF